MAMTTRETRETTRETQEAEKRYMVLIFSGNKLTEIAARQLRMDSAHTQADHFNELRLPGSPHWAAVRNEPTSQLLVQSPELVELI